MKKIYENIDDIARKNKTTPSAILYGLTGSYGNLPTWKKDSFKIETLYDIAEKLGVSVDDLLKDTKYDNKKNILINSNQNNVDIDNSVINSPTTPTDALLEIIESIYKGLDNENKLKLFDYARGLQNNSNEKV